MTTLWALALLAVVGLAYWIRKMASDSTAKKHRSRSRVAAIAQEKEQDRLDCIEAERMLRSGSLADRDGVVAEPPAARRS